MANDDVLGTSVFIRGKSPSGNYKNLIVNEDGSLIIAPSTSSSEVVSISSVAAGVVIGLSTSLTNPVTPSIPLSTAAAITSVSGSTTLAQVIAANAARKGLNIASESTSSGTALVAFTSAATLTSWTLPIAPGGFYEMLTVFTGALSVIHSAGVSTLRVTELS